VRWGMWERLAALGGIVAVALWIIATAILESVGPDEDDPESILRYYQDDSNTILAGGFVFQLGALFFLVFLAVLRHRLWWVEGGPGFLSPLAFAAGIAVAVFALAMPSADMAGALGESDLTPESAQALNTLDVAFFIGAELSAALFLVAAALLAIQLRALPSWLGWISLLLALLLLIPPIGWVGLIFGLPLWVLLVSVLLYIKPVPIPGPPPFSATFPGTRAD
jgi:hypothetical protein